MEKGKPLYDKEFAEIYDFWVTSGYYDYPKEVEEILEIIGERSKILELGIGTGNTAISLAKKGCKVYGIDESKYMLDILARKLDKENVHVNFKLQDINELETDERYDVALSAGGAFWYVIMGNNLTLDGYSTVFGTPEKVDNIFSRVFNSLNENGLFLINVQHHGEYFRLKLSDGTNYWFDMKPISSDSYKKTHYFEKDGKVYLERHFDIFRRYSEDEIDKLAEKIGFEVIGLNKTKNFYTFKKN